MRVVVTGDLLEKVGETSRTKRTTVRFAFPWRM